MSLYYSYHVDIPCFPNHCFLFSIKKIFLLETETIENEKSLTADKEEKHLEFKSFKFRCARAFVSLCIPLVLCSLKEELKNRDTKVSRIEKFEEFAKFLIFRIPMEFQLVRTRTLIFPLGKEGPPLSFH
jgi:hypothetical protein